VANLVAEIIAVGTELLLGNIANTNAQVISQGLSELGIHVYFHTVAGDNDSRLRQALDIACTRSDIIITTGGLGPTYDDITKQTIACFFGVALTPHEATLQKIKDYFTYIKSDMPDCNARQAELPVGCTIMENHWGTAPGCIFQTKGKHALMLPGPPHECSAMFRTCAMPYLESLTQNCIVSKTINIFGMGESALEERLRERMQAAKNPTIAPYAKEGEVQLRVTAAARERDEAERLVTPVVDELCAGLKDVVYGIDADSLEAAVSALLRKKGLTLAAAESCTGGLLGGRITALPGASQVFKGGICAYTNQAKIDLLGIAPQLLEEFDAVSQQVAVAMADGARTKFNSDFAIGITGYAQDNGTVYIALSSKKATHCKQFQLGPNRSRVRTMAVNHALNMLRLDID